MRLIATIAGLMTTALVDARSRIELASNDVQTEIRGAIKTLLAGVAVVLLAAFALLFGAFALVAVYWETDRVRALLLLSGAFALIALAIAAMTRRFLNQKPRFMAATLAELDRDRQRLASLVSMATGGRRS